MSTPPLWWDVTMWTAGAVVGAACFVALYRADPLGFRAWVRERLDNRWELRHPHRLWDVAELRAIGADMLATRTRPSRARRADKRWADYRRRLRLQGAGFTGVFPGGPLGRLP